MLLLLKPSLQTGELDNNIKKQIIFSYIEQVKAGRSGAGFSVETIKLSFSYPPDTGVLFFSGEKRPSVEFDLSRPSNPTKCLYGVNIENVAFLLKVYSFWHSLAKQAFSFYLQDSKTNLSAHQTSYFVALKSGFCHNRRKQKIAQKIIWT